MMHLYLVRFLCRGLFALVVSCGPASPSSQLAPNQLVAVQVYSAIRTDGAFVYYIEDARVQNPGPYRMQLTRVPVNGGTPTVVAQLPAPADVNYMAAFIIDATTAYCPIDGQIIAVPLAGGAPLVLVDTPLTIQTLTADDTSLYWIEGGSLSNATPWGDDDVIMSAPKSGGTPKIVVGLNSFLGANATEIAVAGSNLYWPGSSCPGTGPFRCLDNDVIASVPVGGGAPTELVTAQSHPEAVATDGASLYWLNAGSDSSSGSLQSAPLASPSTVTTIAQAIQSQQTITAEVWNIQVASDGTVFWLDAAGTGVFSPGRTYASGAGIDRISHFTLDAVNVYWTTAYGGIFRTSR